MISTFHSTTPRTDRDFERIKFAMRRVKAAAGNVSQCLLFATRSVYNYISKYKGRFRRTRAPVEAETCPDMHFQHKTGTGVIVDEHGCDDVDDIDEVDVDDTQPVARTSGTIAPEGGFHLFPLLPPELRLRIWQLACAVPRVVELLALDRQRGFRCSAAPRPPPVLHVCLESREAASRIYRRWFGTRAKVPEQQEGEQQRHPPPDKRAIRVNPVHDVVFVRNSYRIMRRSEWDWIVGPSSKWRRQLRKLQRVAFVWSCNPMDLKDTSAWFSIRATRQFWDLQELILLWVLDGAERSLLGRGANVFSSELHSLCHNCTCATEMRSAAEHSREKILATWTTNGIWERLGREPPIITVMHWCTRGAESGYENDPIMN